MKGESITLLRRVKTGEDPGGGEIWDESVETVDDVLIANGAESNSTESNRPDGVMVAHTLYFPRSWTKGFRSLRGCRIRIPGESEECRVVGDPRPLDGGMTPTGWNLAVEVTVGKG